MLLIVLVWIICEQPKRVRKETAMGDDNVLASLSLVSFVMVLAFLLVHSKAVISSPTSSYSFALVLY